MTDMEPTEPTELRSYVISAELPRAHWDALITHLGYIGVTLGDPLDITVPDSTADHLAQLGATQSAELELEPYDGPIADRGDFFRFADEHQISRNVAGRAWSKLTKLYSYKANADYYSGLSWYRPEQYENLPLIFNQTPDKGKEEAWDYEEHLEGLRIDSLEKLLDIVDESVARHGKSGIVKVLGDYSGPIMVELLRAFAEKQRQSYSQLTETENPPEPVL